MDNEQQKKKLIGEIIAKLQTQQNKTFNEEKERGERGEDKFHYLSDSILELMKNCTEV